MRSSSTYRNRWAGRLRVAFYLMAFVATFLDFSYAIDPTRAMSQYVHDRWGHEQGFPRGPVYAITQSTDGYLWIGTEAGLVRFDGLNFRLIQDESTPLTRVLGLTADDEGNLWVRLQAPTLLRYRDGVFQDAVSRLGMPYSNVTGISRGSQGGLLVARLEDGIVKHRRGKFGLVLAATPIARSPVISIAQTSQGDIWLGTRDAGLFRVSDERVTSVSTGLPDTKINCLLPDGDKGLWVGTDNGIVRWNGTEFTRADIPNAGNRFQILAMTRDRDANIWVGTDSRGLLRLNSHGIASLDENARGSREAVTAIFEDREGSLWIGSGAGLERLRDSAFVTYSHSENLPTDGNMSVFTDSDRRTWFSPVKGGLWWFRDGQHGRVTEAGLEGDVVYSIAGGNGELWLGRQRGGLTRLRTGRNSFTAHSYRQSDGLAQDSVYSVYQTRGGSVWAGTLSGGVSKLQDGGFTTYTAREGLASNTVASILESSDGTVWFATPTGLSSLMDGQWQSYTAADGLPSPNVSCLLEDSNGVLWVGTAAGLAFRAGKRFQVPGVVPAPLREQILGIAEDRYESLWMATTHHVLRVKRQKLMQGSLADGDVREYGLADGLRGVEGVKRHRSVVTDSLGRIWFSMNRGISVVDPARLASASATAIVKVEAISADGTSMDLRSPIQIPAGSQRITFNYAGLSLSIPERVRFRYRLDGFDPDWSESVSARSAIYTNLAPGSYAFRVIASNADGVWNGEEAKVGFEMAAQFWQTWWFRLSCGLACIFAMLGFYRLRVRQMARRFDVRLEERLAERTRMARELHDTLLQGFLSASMQLHVAEDQVPSDSPAKPLLGRVLRLMSDVIEEGRSAVQGLRSSSGGPENLEEALSRIPEELAVKEPIDFRVIVEGGPRPLHPVIRDEVYRIGREGIVNALRHSGAKKIEVELEYARKHLRVLVRDNGCGVDVKVLQAGREGHWGLTGMRERAERIGARFKIMSRATVGTEVELLVPGHIIFQHQASGHALGWFSRIYPRSTRAGDSHRS